MTISAQGVDVSSWQVDLTRSFLAAYDFAFCKATEGVTFTDPHFRANWSALDGWGKPRGAYHFFRPTIDPIAQAKYFLATVKAAGLKDGDMLVCDSETAGPNVGNLTRQFLDYVHAQCPHSPVLVYANLGFLPNLASCTGYPLWVADYTSSAPNVAPWSSWRFWQFSDVPEDRDAFNGSVSALGTFVRSYLPVHPTTLAPSTEDDKMPNGVIRTPVGVAENHGWLEGSASQIVLFSLWSGVQPSPPVIELTIAHMNSTPFTTTVTLPPSGTFVYKLTNKSDVNGCSFKRTDTGAATVAYHTNV